MTVYDAACRFHKVSILPDEHWNLFRRDLVEWTSYPGSSVMRSYFVTYNSPDLEFMHELEQIFDEDLPAQADDEFLGS